LTERDTVREGTQAGGVGEWVLFVW